MQFPLLAILIAVAAQDDTPPAPKDVDRAIDSGAEYLLKSCDRDPGAETFRGDELVLYALVHAGLAKDPRAVALLKRIRDRGLDDAPYPAYTVSLRCMLLERLDPVQYQVEIAQCAWWLVNAQTDNGQWDYNGPVGPLPRRFEPVKWPGKVETGEKTRTRAALKVERTEKWQAAAPKAASGKIYRNSSTMQYALLGLYAAQRSHIVIPRETWTRALKILLKSQGDEGGWGYIDADDKANSWQPQSHLLPGMTAGSLAGLAVLKDVLDCNDPELAAAVEKGFKYLGRDLKMTNTVGETKFEGVSLALLYHYYFMFSVERAGILWGHERIGRTMWYAAGARELLRLQQKDGSWGQDYGKASDRLANTSFAVLFLKRAVPPPVATGDAPPDK